MKRRICTVLLSLCSLIGGAERKSNASIIGKVLKYGSAAVGTLDTLFTSVLCLTWLKYRYNYPNIKEADEHKHYYDVFFNLPCLSWVPFVHTSHDIRVLIAGTLLGDLLFYGSYKLGQYLDKDDTNQEKKSFIRKGTVSAENKSSSPKDKNQNLHENSKKSKI